MIRVRAARFSAFLLFILTLVPAGLPANPPQSAQPAPGKVYIVLWFDTEDYILPQSDDSAKRIAAFLTQQGIRATFKVVGEKARVLDRRGRKDVIEALDRHEIGYHSNTHSQHPTVAEYESTLGWRAGIEEFDRRERPGYDDIRRIFGKAPTCYGQPGDSWAPQCFPALKKWGVKVYLDEAGQVGLNGKPFWYGGLLNIFNTTEGKYLRANDDWSNLDDIKAKFRGDYERMTSEGGGLISIYYHPCEFIHQQFWDAVNFAKGANPPPGEWKLPPMKTPAEIERHFKFFEDSVLFMKSFPQVRFVTASEAYALYPDLAQKKSFDDKALADIANQVNTDVSFQTRNGYALTASEVFDLLNQYVVRKVRRQSSGPILLNGTPYGPSSPFTEFNRGVEVPWNQFSRTALDVADFLRKNGQIPSAVWFGSTAAPPESYLAALADVTKTIMTTGKLPETVTIPPASLAAGKYVAQDSPELWGWIIFPPGFHAPKLMELARLQAWTLKPAILQPPRSQR